MFSLTSLKCFAAAAEELNFTRAAKRLFISQQALSSHISKLEEYYGVRLFDRGIPMTLTDAGRALQKHAREILSSVDDYAREVQDIKNFRQGELTVGIPVTRGTIMLPPLLSAFHQLFPQIRLHLVEGTVSGNIADALYDGTADLCIGYQPENTEELAVTPLFEEKFVVLVPDRLMKEHHLDRKLGEGALSMDRFAELPFVVQHPETMNGRDRAGSGGLHPESDHGGIPVHGGDGGLCAASDLPVTRPAALRPREHPPVQPGGAGQALYFPAGYQRDRPVPDLSLPPEEQAAHPGGPGIHQPGPGNLQRRQRWSNTASISFRVVPIKESMSSSRG